MNFHKAEWLELIITWAPFETQKVELRIFHSVTHSYSTKREFTAKEDLDPREQEVPPI